MANQMPPTVLARMFRFHQIRPQNAKPISGRIASRKSAAAEPCLLCDHGELPEAGEVDSHKREKRAEVEQLARVFIGAANVDSAVRLRRKRARQ